MKDYFSKKKRGGVITSKIEHQDTVGSILALELLNENKYCDILDSWKIMCEGNDDLEILSPSKRIFIQIKSSEVNSINDLKEILSNFKNNMDQLYINAPEIKPQFILYSFGGFSGKNIKNFPEKHKEYINTLGVYTENETARVRDALLEILTLGPEYSEVIDSLEIRTQHFNKNDDDTLAIFSHKLRLMYNIRDFGDKLITDIYNELLNKFSDSRRNRHAISKKEILQTIHSKINFNENFIMDDISLQTGYEKTDIGYVKSSTKNSEKIEKEVTLVYKKIRKEWFKAYSWVPLVNLFFGYWQECKCCGHPLNANLGGSLGLACPDCGYQPYATLFLACSCGDYKVIKNQPALSVEEFYEAVRIYHKMGNQQCTTCGKDIFEDTYWKYRLLCLPYPHPMTDVTDKIKADIPFKKILFISIILIIIVYIFFIK